MSVQQELWNGSLTIPSSCSWLCTGRSFILRSLLKSSRKGHGRRILSSLLTTFSVRISTRQTHLISPAPPRREMISNHQFTPWRHTCPSSLPPSFSGRRKSLPPSPLHKALNREQNTSTEWAQQHLRNGSAFNVLLSAMSALPLQEHQKARTSSFEQPWTWLFVSGKGHQNGLRLLVVRCTPLSPSGPLLFPNTWPISGLRNLSSYLKIYLYSRRLVTGSGDLFTCGEWFLFCFIFSPFDSWEGPAVPDWQWNWESTMSVSVRKDRGPEGPGFSWCGLG